MTREEANKKIESLHINDIQTSGLHLIINKIYDDFQIEKEKIFHDGVLNGNKSMEIKIETKNCEFIKHWAGT